MKIGVTKQGGCRNLGGEGSQPFIRQEASLESEHTLSEQNRQGTHSALGGGLSLGQCAVGKTHHGIVGSRARHSGRDDSPPLVYLGNQCVSLAECFFAGRVCEFGVS